jgi:hypothetical protein
MITFEIVEITLAGCRGVIRGVHIFMNENDDILDFAHLQRIQRAYDG